MEMNTSIHSGFGKKTWAIAAPSLALIVTFAWLGLCGTAMAETVPPVAKISKEQATEIALKEVPGEATSVAIERKLGKDVYVVEVRAKDEKETDVFVDIETGKVVGTD